MEKPVKVKILDNEYLIRSEEEDIEEVLKIAEYVNEKVKEVNEGSEGLTEKKTAILAALYIASDYFHVLKERDALVADIRERSGALIRSIDALIR